MKPYYEDKKAGIVLYHGDCRDILPTIAAGSVDLVLTDPKYNVGIEYGDHINDKMPACEYEAWCRDWYSECVRAARAVAFTPGIKNLGMWYRIDEPKWIVAWHKPAAMGRSPFGFCNWEPVLVFGSGFKPIGVDVVTAPIITRGDHGCHPCPKPIEWAKGLICLLSDEGTVLDIFAGSGTTLRAAKDLGRKAIGIELEEKYCEIAANRLRQEVLQFGE